MEKHDPFKRAAWPSPIRFLNVRLEESVISIRTVKPWICICCGQTMASNTRQVAGNPNVCSNCSRTCDEVEASPKASAGGSAIGLFAGRSREGFLSLSTEEIVLSVFSL